jgi:hypothetical protein
MQDVNVTGVWAQVEYMSIKNIGANVICGRAMWANT